MNIELEHASIRLFLPCLLLTIAGGCGGGGGAPSNPVVGPNVQSFILRDVVRIDGGSGCPEPSVGRNSCVALRSSTRVTVDGRAVDAADVRQGTFDYSVTFVEGTSTGATPTGLLVSSMDIQQVAVGTVEAIDSVRQRFVVLGQRIYMTPSTAVDGVAGTVAALAVGDRVGVSGFFSSDGQVVATAVRHADAGADVTLRGIASASQGGGLAIGGMDLNLTNAALTNFPNGTVAEGDPVLVFGEIAGGVLVADSVQFIGGAWGTHDGFRSAAFVGMISRRSTASDLEVEGRSVDCAFFQCSTAAGMTGGVIARLDQIGGGGRIDIVAPMSPNTRIVGPIDAKDVQGGSLRILGLDINLLPATGIVDAAGEPATIEDIRVGDSVGVDAALIGDAIIAGSIAPDSQEPSVTTTVATYADPNIHIGGQTITTDAATAVHDDCNELKDLPWLFAEAEQSSIIQLRVEAVTGGGALVASNVVADVAACPWDY